MFTVQTPKNIVSQAMAAIQATGRSVELTCAFEQIAATLTDVRAQDRDEKRKGISAEADPHLNQMTADNAFYVAVHGPDGDLQAFCSARCFQVGSEKLAGFWGAFYSRLYGGGAPAIDVDDLPPPAYQAQGSIVFISDLYISASATQQFDTGHLAMTAIGEAVRRFDPDHVYGFARHVDVMRGLAARYLCTGWYYAALPWLVDTHPWQNDDWLLIMDRADYKYALDRYVRSITPPTG